MIDSCSLNFHNGFSLFGSFQTFFQNYKFQYLFKIPFLTNIYASFKIILGIGLSITTVGLIALYKYQNFLIYPTSINNGQNFYETPDKYGMKYNEVELETEDGEMLHCFLLKHNQHDPYYKNKTVVLLSPNAGNVSHYLSIAEIFFKNYGYNVFAYSYRGYGRSTGKPTEEGLKSDARAVLNYLADDLQYARSNIILYGRSLGGAVAIYMASLASQRLKSFRSFDDINDDQLEGSTLRQRKLNTNDKKNNKSYSVPKVSGVILENTFLCLPKVIPYIFPILKYFTSLCHEKWDSEEEILKLDHNIPILFLNGLKDEIVPPQHMQTLYNLAPSNKKFIHFFENAYHNDTCNQPSYWDIVYNFIENIDST